MVILCHAIVVEEYMEMTKLANTNYIYEKDLEDSTKVGKAFENGNLDYLYVLNSYDDIVGVFYLEDFCNLQEIYISEEIPQDNDCVSDEKKLLEKLKLLTSKELLYIRNEIVKNLGKNYVCCCSVRLLAEKILMLLFDEDYTNISIVDKVNELSEGEHVLFLSFRKIKLYRKMHTARISDFVALNNLTLDSINQKTFYEKYPDLIENFKRMQVGFIYAVIPEKKMLNCLSQESLDRIAGFGKADYEFYEVLLGGKESGDYISCIEQNRLSRVINNGIYKSLEDCKSEFYNVVGGMRVTTNQPNEYKHKIYIFGPCTARGAMVEDCHTIASIVQSMVIEYSMPYIVLNCGVGGGSDLENTYRYIVSLPICPGDIVVLVEEGQFLDDKTIDDNYVISLADGFNKAFLKKEWFLDRPAHCNAEANRVISKQIVDKILEVYKENTLCEESQMVRLFKGKKKIYEDSIPLKRYVDYLSREKFDIENDSVVGSITMHCNPITKGHKYLIETALDEVDYLYIFILSEDKSEIPFSLRKKLLVHEVSEFSNVKVLECGEFMASTMTFPEYFSKELNKESRVDASKDILTFCQHVASTLNITKRFVGTENRDFVTRQYNSQLKMILPMYGIEVREINRIENRIGSISAHSTRKFIADGDWESAGEMVSKYVLSELKRFYEVEYHD